MEFFTALKNKTLLENYLPVKWEIDCRRLSGYYNKYKFDTSKIENFFSDIVNIITIILNFLLEKAFPNLFHALQTINRKPSESIIEHKSTIRENTQKLSLHEELNYFKFFYTPI
ncbi:hypothetical protein Dip510_001333 [Elusimicrobium posterum]|uniref:hypothetical protein n=1 Tax=Elusimicrobium posterum TaxID=3116653 RepID=UPI003C724D82